MPNALGRGKTEDAIAWNDIEALPLYGATALLMLAVAYGLADAGPALQTTTGKVVAVIGCLGLRFAWLGMDEAGGSSSQFG